MFSWIVESKAEILNINNWIFTIRNSFEKDSILIGQSIAHDWACMSITNIDLQNNTYKFFAMNESLSCTNFWFKKLWDFFNVERCINLQDRLDWHIVSWHIDCIWEINAIITNNDWSKQLEILCKKEFGKYLISKWSISINGVSLTIVNDDIYKDLYASSIFSINLIPLTQQLTNLWTLIIGDKVNLEFDLIGKYIYKQHPFIF